MKKNSKFNLLLNALVIAGIIFLLIYFFENSLQDIFNEIKETPLKTLIMITGLGLMYQVIEGQSISVIAAPFMKENEKFTAKDGFFMSCSIAFFRVISLGAATLVTEINFYKKKGMKISQGIGVASLHMVLYKMAVAAYAFIGLLIQGSFLANNAPKMIPFIIIGLIMTVGVIAILLALSSSVNLQVGLLLIANRLFKNQKLRDLVDKGNLQIYSLRETVATVTSDKTVWVRSFFWNLLKLVFWYVVPYVVLVPDYPQLDFLQIFSFISFSVILAGVIPAPAGVGSLEFVYLLLFQPLVGTVDALSSVLLYRFASYVLPVIIGFIYFLFDRRNKMKTDIEEVRKEQAAEE
ncbi:uncharacterized membrane protein YbhN (UPF0104 family) [Enterococcus sp. PF1-24]|nr:uncharacterized membrane protein YbhN (UPF0104 family) [Enterococcus sp. PFB1-1]MDH6402326.1 uncharacterized membrane protein YbhN (UPF0104 family) [Enterococcus sp. PF1-24]